MTPPNTSYDASYLKERCPICEHSELYTLIEWNGNKVLRYLYCNHCGSETSTPRQTTLNAIETFLEGMNDEELSSLKRELKKQS